MAQLFVRAASLAVLFLALSCRGADLSEGTGVSSEVMSKASNHFVPMTDANSTVVDETVRSALTPNDRVFKGCGVLLGIFVAGGLLLCAASRFARANWMGLPKRSISTASLRSARTISQSSLGGLESGDDGI